MINKLPNHNVIKIIKSKILNNKNLKKRIKKSGKNQKTKNKIKTILIKKL